MEELSGMRDERVGGGDDCVRGYAGAGRCDEDGMHRSNFSPCLSDQCIMIGMRVVRTIHR